MKRWLVFDPISGEWNDFVKEEAAREAFDDAREALEDVSAEDLGWPENSECLSLVAADDVLTYRLVPYAAPDDNSADGARCREMGWDSLSRGVVDEEPAPECPSCAHLRADLAHGQEVQRVLIHALSAITTAAGISNDDADTETVCARIEKMRADLAARDRDLDAVTAERDRLRDELAALNLGPQPDGSVRQVVTIRRRMAAPISIPDDDEAALDAMEAADRAAKETR